MKNEISAFTDGSCNPTFRIGAWVSIVLTADKKRVLQGNAADTTHQRMELTAAIRTLEYILENKLRCSSLTLFTDSQYVIGLGRRRQKMISSGFETNKKKPVANADLIRQFFVLCDRVPVILTKVKAHQKKSFVERLNGEADKLCRKLVRELTAQQEE